jgi:hypothetical protein
MQVQVGEVLTTIIHKVATLSPQLEDHQLHTNNLLQDHHKGIHLVDRIHIL